MIHIDRDTLDTWLNDYESFNYAFREFCNAHFRIHNLHAEFIPNVTRQIHKQWCEDHALWLAQEAHENTKYLSHVKICALLLANLIAEPFLGNFFDHDYNEEPIYHFRGTSDQKDKAKRDLVDGREVSLSLDFVIIIVDWHERYRVDRNSPFVQPLTEDMRHDLMNLLIGGVVDKKSLYLILKALYLRPNGGGKAN